MVYSNKKNVILSIQFYNLKSFYYTFKLHKLNT